MLDIALKLVDRVTAEIKAESAFRVKLLNVFVPDREGNLLEDRATTDFLRSKFEQIEHPVDLLDVLVEPLVYLVESTRLQGRALFLPHGIMDSLKEALPAHDARYIYWEGRRVTQEGYFKALSRQGSRRVRYERRWESLPKKGE